MKYMEKIVEISTIEERRVDVMPLGESKKAISIRLQIPQKEQKQRNLLNGSSSGIKKERGII